MKEFVKENIGGIEITSQYARSLSRYGFAKAIDYFLQIQQLGPFQQMLKKLDPTGCYEVTYLDPEATGIQRFHSFFFSPSWWTATAEHFTPILTVDGTAVETVVGGCLLTAVSKTSNNNLFPFAVMYCPSETGPLVQQFGAHLRQLLPKQEDALSDSGTGLINGLEMAQFRYNGGCFYHIVYKNAQAKVSPTILSFTIQYKYHLHLQNFNLVDNFIAMV